MPPLPAFAFFFLLRFFAKREEVANLLTSSLASLAAGLAVQDKRKEEEKPNSQKGEKQKKEKNAPAEQEAGFINQKPAKGKKGEAKNGNKSGTFFVFRRNHSECFSASFFAGFFGRSYVCNERREGRGGKLCMFFEGGQKKKSEMPLYTL